MTGEAYLRQQQGAVGRTTHAQQRESDFKNMKDFLNIQIASEDEFSPGVKVKAQSLSPSKLNQSKICSLNGQMILNLNKGKM